MRFSIVVPSYNSSSTLSSLLNAIPHKDEEVEEILIVDSSEENERKRIEELMSDFEKVRVIHRTEKTIPAIARNIGAEAANGDVLIFIDADAYPDSNWLPVIKDACRQGCRVGGGSVELPPFQEGKKIETAQYYLQFNEFLPSLPRETRDFIPSCNFFCEKQLFDEVGGFPDIRASEDVLFGHEVNKRAVISFLPEAKVFHIFGSTAARLKSNQKLLGRYVAIYRKQEYGGWFYSNVVQYALSPLFLLVKIFLLTSRIMRLDRLHRRRYGKVFSAICIGLLYWTSGYISGIGKQVENNG